MPISIVPKIKGAAELLKNIKLAERLTSNEGADHVESLGQQFITGITDYPPENEGNRPPPPYWVRGVGRVQNRAGLINPVSQNFKQSWRLRVTRGLRNSRATVETDVTYTEPLVGTPFNPSAQAGFHARHGWQTIVSVLQRLGIVATPTSSALGELKSRIEAKLQALFR